MTNQDVPTLYEWLGGIDALNRLTTRFYEHVKTDSLLAPVFAHMGADHPSHVAAFLAGLAVGGHQFTTRRYRRPERSHAQVGLGRGQGSVPGHLIVPRKHQ